MIAGIGQGDGFAPSLPAVGMLLYGHGGARLIPESRFLRTELPRRSASGASAGANYNAAGRHPRPSIAHGGHRPTDRCPRSDNGQRLSRRGREPTGNRECPTLPACGLEISPTDVPRWSTCRYRVSGGGRRAEGDPPTVFRHCRTRPDPQQPHVAWCGVHCSARDRGSDRTRIFGGSRTRAEGEGRTPVCARLECFRERGSAFCLVGRLCEPPRIDSTHAGLVCTEVGQPARRRDYSSKGCRPMSRRSALRIGLSWGSLGLGCAIWLGWVDGLHGGSIVSHRP